jgi:hypothetical protein
MELRFGQTEVLAYLLKHNLIDGSNMTITGLTLGENLDRWTHKYGELPAGQDVIRPLENPIKKTGHIRYVLVLSVIQSTQTPTGTGSSRGTLLPEVQSPRSPARRDLVSPDVPLPLTQSMPLSRLLRPARSKKARKLSLCFAI